MRLWFANCGGMRKLIFLALAAFLAGISCALADVDDNAIHSIVKEMRDKLPIYAAGAT